MDNITSIKKKYIDSKLKTKPFGTGMYAFLMFLIDYYRRVRTDLKMDFDSFVIVQVVVSHGVYLMQSERSKSFSEITDELNKLSEKNESDTSDVIFRASELMAKVKKNKLTISSICQVTTLPKETVRRKVQTLCKKNILSLDKNNGVLIGTNYKKIYEAFVPSTHVALSQLMKKWKRADVIDYLLKL